MRSSDRDRFLQQPGGALLELLDRDGELDRILSGAGLTFDSKPPPPATPLPPRLEIPPPDWDQEERERLARERAENPDPGLVEETPREHPPPAQGPA